MSFEDATRWFTVYDSKMTPRQATIVGTIVNVDAFAVATNVDGSVDALIDVNLDENGGYVELRMTDLMTDTQTGVTYAVTRIDGGDRHLMITASQSGTRTGVTPPALPPTS